jgi:hypothetical protein
MANTPINVRSPRIIDISGTAGQATKLELYIWNDPDSIPTNPTYTLEKPVPSSLVTTCAYDLSPYCRNYITHLGYTEVTADTAAPVGEYCFCTAKSYLDGVLQATATLICFDGYGYQSEGENPAHVDQFLTAGSYYINSTGNSGGIYYHDDQVATWEARWTGLQSGGTTTITLGEEVGYIPYINTAYQGEGNKLELIKASTVQNTYYFYELDECKYDAINCDFVNKFGGWQRIVFFKASRSSFEMTNTEYNLMPSSTTYNVLDNVRKVFNVNGMEKISVNTGWVFESYSDVIIQLMLSEKILLDNVPVILDTKSVELQKNINDKNINYKLDFKYSAPKLNYNI